MYVRLYVLALLLLTLPAPGNGEDRRPLREARSDNGRYHLRIDAGRGEYRRCRATLFEQVAEQKRDRRVWRAKLVSQVAPRHALIRNDGCFVVTLDEFRRGGAAHALVIYNEHGKLLREFDLRELLHGDDWKQVTVAQGAVEWLSEAEFTFVDSPPQFVIKLRGGRELRIDLEEIKLLPRKPGADAPTSRPSGDKSRAEGDATDPAIPPEILALLEAPTSAPAPAGEAASEAATAEAILRALAQLQQLSNVSGIDADVASAIASAGLTDAVAAVRDTAVTRSDPNQPPQYAGLSAELGFPVPLPNPADPVDYVAWVVSLTETEGPSAVPLYESAIAKRIPWEGDEELYKAARRGDPEALASPEIIEWLEANQDALVDFRAAAQFEYRGMLEVGEDDSVLGILLPSLSEKRALARAAIIEAKYLEANGEVDAALGSYLDNLAVGAQTSQGPTLIDTLVGRYLQEETADNLLDCFASQRGDEIDYVQLAEELEDGYRPLRPITECFQGERAMAFDVLQRAYEWNPEGGTYRVADDGLEQYSAVLGYANPPFEGLAMSFALGSIGFEKMVAQANKCYDDLTEAALLPYQEATQELNKLEAHVGSPDFRKRNPLLATLLPSLGRMNHLATRGATTRNATRLITNLRAYRQQYGEYPDSLDVFGDAEMTIDPFTGNYFVYQRDGDDFTLYSLGGNGVDDGGAHDWRADTNDVLYWPRPPRN